MNREISKETLKKWKEEELLQFLEKNGIKRDEIERKSNLEQKVFNFYDTLAKKLNQQLQGKEMTLGDLSAIISVEADTDDDIFATDGGYYNKKCCVGSWIFTPKEGFEYSYINIGIFVMWHIVEFATEDRNNEDLDNLICVLEVDTR